METSHSSPTPMSDGNTHSSRVPDSSGHFEVNGHRLYWEWYGPKVVNPIVLLHHGLGSIRSWKHQIPVFLDVGRSVLVFDRWGYGGSDVRDSFAPRFMHEDAEETVEMFNFLGIKSVDLVGHSDGGSISLIIAGKYPELISRLVLVAAHIYIEQKMIDELKTLQEDMSPQFIRLLEREHGKKAEALIRAWADSWREHGDITLDLANELTNVKCPTLVIQGELDEHATPQQSIDIAEGIPEANLWLIPGIGHMPPQDMPDVFNEKVLNFLSKKYCFYEYRSRIPYWE